MGKEKVKFVTMSGQDVKIGLGTDAAKLIMLSRPSDECYAAGRASNTPTRQWESGIEKRRAN